MEKQVKEIVNGEFVNIVYNGNVFLLVDEFTCGDKRIYYFNSIDGELFCYKVDNDYEIIESEKVIDKVREENNLYEEEFMYSSKFKSVSSKLVFVNEQSINGEKKHNLIDSIIETLKQFSPELDYIELKSILELTPYKVVDRFRGRKITGAAYHIPSKTVLIDKNYKSESKYIHESIHALTFYKLSKKDRNRLGNGFIEGATEYITRITTGKEKSSKLHGLTINYDIGNMDYVYNSILSSQMCFLTNSDPLRMLTDEKDKTISTFIQNYGLNNFLRFRYLNNRLYKKDIKNKGTHFEFLILQEELLKKCFDEEFKKVKDYKSAKKYFEKLNEFGNYRAKVDERDSFLEEYYNDKLKKCSKKIKMDLTDPFEYTPCTFKPNYLKSDTYSRMICDFKNFLKHNKEALDVRLYKLEKNGKEYGIFKFDDEEIIIEYKPNSSSYVDINYDMSELEEMDGFKVDKTIKR